ncbi:MAG TPA: response regulator [Flavisolibacter sp.]|jgi:CheY-like chemotaxis protein|nr:response regulator [Flavisolibacter sp.]
MVSGKILLVDDDPEDRDIIRDAMELLGAADNILFAGNGEQALDLLNKDFSDVETPCPCVIILDLNMPRLNGTQTLLRLKEDVRFRNIPVIIYSTSINPLEMETCMRSGAHSYITKPVSFDHTMAVVRKFLQFCGDVQPERLVDEMP